MFSHFKLDAIIIDGERIGFLKFERSKFGSTPLLVVLLGCLKD